MQRRIDAFRHFWTQPRNIFWLGLVIAVVATSLEVLRGRAENFAVFSDATVNFWNGISSYTDEFQEQHRRFYIYSPVFNVLFAPFAYLPRVVGAYAWNLLNYALLMAAICHLPASLRRHRAGIMLFLLCIISQSIFCFQYNLSVAWMFLWAYILLERGKGFWAVLLIMVSATTKIYGGIELGLLLCYPRFWRNAGYAALCGVVLLALPVLKTGVDGLVPWYADWFAHLTQHHEITGTYPSLVFMPPFDTWFLPNMRWVQAIGLCALTAVMFSQYRRWSDFSFRAQLLGIMMGYIVLFSEAAESHTYVIALAGYMLCYYTWAQRTKLDALLYWGSLVFMSLMPIDMFCPPKVHRFLNGQLFIGVYIFTAIWLTMVYKAVRTNGQTENANKLTTNDDISQL